MTGERPIEQIALWGGLAVLWWLTGTWSRSDLRVALVAAVLIGVTNAWNVTQSRNRWRRAAKLLREKSTFDEAATRELVGLWPRDE